MICSWCNNLSIILVAKVDIYVVDAASAVIVFAVRTNCRTSALPDGRLNRIGMMAAVRGEPHIDILKL